MQIHYAAAHGDIAEVERQIHLGYSVNEDASGSFDSFLTPLIFAAESQFAGVDVLRFLVKRGAWVNPPHQKTSQTPLCMAAKSGSVAKVRYLLENGADVRFRSASGYTPLIHAVFSHAPKSRVLKIARLLLDAGAYPDIVTNHRQSPVQVASYIGYFSLVRLLLDRGANIEQLQWNPLHKAAATGSLADVAHELDDYSDYDTEDRWHRNPLQLAIMTGDVRKAKLLLARGAELQGNELSFAGYADNPAMVHWLLNLGQKPDDPTQYTDRPLIVAAGNASTRCVKLLLEAGAQVNDRNSTGSSALEAAATPEIVRLLVNAGANINYVNGEGYNLLKYAAEDGRASLVKALLEMGADPNVSSTGETPLYVAVRADHAIIVELLLRAGADPNITTVDDWHVLHSAKSLKTLRLLLDAGANPEYKGGFDQKPADYHTDSQLIAILKDAERKQQRRAKKAK